MRYAACCGLLSRLDGSAAPKLPPDQGQSRHVIAPRDGLDWARFNCQLAVQLTTLPARACPFSQIRNDHVCFILARPSYDRSLAEVPSVAIQLRPIFTCSYQAPTR